MAFSDKFYLLKFSFSVTYHQKSEVEMTETFHQAFPTCNFTQTTIGFPSSNSTNYSINPSTTTDSTSFRTSSEKVSVTITSSKMPEKCVCFQKCPQSSNITELEETIELINKNLTISRSVTSKYKRKFVSAEDNRPSSKVMGTLAIVFISVVICSIIFLDNTIVFYKILVKIKEMVCVKNNRAPGENTSVQVQPKPAQTSTV